MKTNLTKEAGADEIDAPRVRDCTAARDIYIKYDRAHGQRRATMAKVRGQLEGNRPMSQESLNNAGEGYRTNVNFRQSEAGFNRTVLPYWKMVHDVPNKIAPTVESNSPQVPKITKAIAESFDLWINDVGSDYLFNFMLIAQDFVKFGPSYATWPHPTSPRFEHARTEGVLLPARAKSNISKWEICCIEGEMTISDLWEQIRTVKKAQSASYVGWNVEAVKETITWAKNSSDTTRKSNWTETQDAVASNDISASELWGPVKTVRMFVKNFNGSVACYVFTRDASGSKEFLYKNENHAKSFTQAIAGLFYDVGVGGLVHSIKGYGIKNYYFSVMQDRFQGRLVDAAMFSTSINFQKTDDTPNEGPPVANHGAVNIFPRNLTQMTAYPQLGNASGVLDMLQSNQADNNAIYRDATKGIADTQTAKQAVILAGIADEVGSATASLYLAQVSNIFAECFRRLIMKSDDPDAKNFIRRLKARGVTDKAIELMRSTGDDRIDVTIRTGANPGTAGAALRDSILKDLLGMAHMPGMNFIAIRDAYLANRLGTAAVSQFTLSQGVESMPAQRREAMIENQIFGAGQPLPVDPADAHFEQSDEHLKPLEGIIASFQKTGKISTEQLTSVQMALPHVQQHVAYLKQDETMIDEFKQVWPRLSNVTSVLTGILAQLKRERAQAVQAHAQQQQLRAQAGGQPIAGQSQNQPPPQPTQ